MINIPKHICAVLDVLNSNGFEGYLVGGCVRDYLMGKQAHDFDITTNALPNEIISCFNGMRIIETGLKHGTVTVVSEGENVEITTYRIDGEYVDNRHPENVVFTRNIHEDLSRRDFTVNALAYSPYDGLVDLFGGEEDIKNKIIRCVGNPDERFNEDGLRIMRALRFSSVLSFDIHYLTQQSIHKNKSLLCNISRERIFSELKKLLCGKGSSGILNNFFDVFCVIFPDLIKYKEQFITNTEHISALPDDIIIRFSNIFFNLDTNFVKKAMKSLKPDKNLYRDVLILHKHLSEPLLCDDISVKYIMRDLEPELIKKLIILKKEHFTDFNDRDFNKKFIGFINSGECVSLSQLAVNGNDLLEYGITKGPVIGEILNRLLAEVIEGRCCNEKLALINCLKNLCI